MTLARQIASYVEQTGLRDFDHAVIERAKDLCLSSIGSTVLGATMEVPHIMAAYVRELGGAAEAGVVGFAFDTTAEMAAMLNCNASHCTELEDVAWPEAQYTCCIIPAMFSLADRLGNSGAELLEAVILGFEVAARPGMTCSNGGAAARGFLSCANVGTLGVAAGAAKLMKLSREQIEDAITLAPSLGGGLVRQTGSAAHVLEAGFAGRDGITAASLAARGLGGNPTILNGRAGYFDALAGQPQIAFDLGTGSDLRVMAVGQKKYPCCYLLQRIVDAVKALVVEHAVDPAQVAEVVVDVNAAFPTIVKYPEPADVEEARFSLPHVVAAALVGEPMDVHTFSASKLHEPRIAALRPKIRAEVHEDWGYDQLGARDELTIRLNDGRVLTATCTIAKGDAAAPLSRDETIAKFRSCTDGLIPADAQRRVLAMLCGLEELNDISRLMDLLTDIQVAPASAA